MMFLTLSDSPEGLIATSSALVSLPKSSYAATPLFFIRMPNLLARRLPTLQLRCWAPA
jgi:hypothetical protein